MGYSSLKDDIMLNKQLTLILGIVVIVGLAALAVFLFLPDEASESQEILPDTPAIGVPPSVKPPAQGMGNNGGLTISLHVADGTSLQVKNFKQHPDFVADPLNPGNYYLGYNTIGDPTKKVPYTILYIDTIQYFNVVLLQEPLGRARKAAERYLMERLGVSQNDMCRLSYQLGAPGYVNEAYAGRELGFSFCSGSVSLPE